MLIYIASPYSHPEPAIRHIRYEIAQSYIEKMFSREPHITRISPIVYLHPSASRTGVNMPTKAEHYAVFNKNLLDKCDAMEVLKMPHIDKSVGVKMELKWAHDLDLPITYVNLIDLL